MHVAQDNSALNQRKSDCAQQAGHRRALNLTGTSLWIAWNIHFLVLCPDTAVISFDLSHPYVRIAVLVGYLLASVIAVAAGGRRMDRLYRSYGVVALVGVTFAAGVSFYALLFGGEGSFPLWLACLMGAATLTVTTIWMHVLSNVPGKAYLFKSMGGTTATGVVLGYLLSLVQGTLVGVVAGVVVVGLSLVCLLFVRRMALESEAGQDGARGALATSGAFGARDASIAPDKFGASTASGASRFDGGVFARWFDAVPAKILAAGALFCGALGLTIASYVNLAPTQSQPMPAGWEALGMFLSALLFLFLNRRPQEAEHLSPVTSRLTVTLLVCGLFMLQAASVFAPAFIGLSLAAGVILLHLYSKTLYLDIAWRTGRLPLEVFFQASACNYAAALLGAALVLILPDWLLEFPGISALAMAVSLLLLAVVGSCFKKDDIATCWGLCPRGAQVSVADTAGPGAAAAGAAGPGAAGLGVATTASGAASGAEGKEAPFRDAVERVSDEAKLTPREREVFMLLAKGYRASEIKDELGISLGTVRNHVNHIYLKLDVHTFEEMRALVERAKSEDC